MIELTRSDSPILRGTVDGVPVLHVPGGPLTAELIFRVGAGDEPLPSRGISHLVEHLALSTIGQTTYPYNGEVTPFFTRFPIQGTAEQVTAHLDQLCSAITALPLDRLHDEIAILRIESASKPFDPVSRALRTRFQLNGIGGAAFDELALLGVDLPDVQSWARRWFNAQNAMLWVSGDLPDALHLTLPTGQRMALAEPKIRAISTPAWVPGAPGICAFSMSVPRSMATGALLQTIHRRAVQHLRRTMALAYDINLAYTHVAAHLAEATAWFVVTPETSAPATQAFNEILEELAHTGPSQGELQEFGSGSHSTDLDVARAQLRGNAERELLGDPHDSPLDLRRQREAVTPGEVQSIAAAAVSSRLVWSPTPHSPVPGLGTVDDFSHSVFLGRKYHRRLVSTGETLSVGPEGISYRSKKSGVKAIPVQSIRASLAWPNGKRRVFGDGDATITVEPNQWLRSRQLARDIDTIVPHGLTVRADASRLPTPTRFHFNRRLLVPFVGYALILLLQSVSPYTSRTTLLIAAVGGGLLLTVLTLLRAGLPLDPRNWLPLVRRDSDSLSWDTTGPALAPKPFPKRPRPKMTVSWWALIVLATLIGLVIGVAAGHDPVHPANDNGWPTLVGGITGCGVSVGAWRLLCRRY
jgi:zinc protease